MGERTKIDWCDSTWNPVTGCLHGCDYCYARKIARRFGDDCEKTLFLPDGVNVQYGKTAREDLYEVLTPVSVASKNGEKHFSAYPFGFRPTMYRYLLDKPQEWKTGRRVFVCSMADLFGYWVPDEWIRAVFDACGKAPQHKYLFLTKNPKRYETLQEINIHVSDNVWLGYTSTGGNAYTGFKNFAGYNTFVSIEPLIVPFGDDLGLYGMKWIIIGAETGNRKDKVVPEKEWVMKIARTARAANMPVFMKESLRKIVGRDFVQEFPF